MKFDIIQYWQRLGLLAITVLLLCLSPSYAQIGELGIYGGAPTPTATPFACGTPAKVRLESYPEIDGGLNMTLPLNSLKNFNFYYTEDGNGFLSGGGYKLTYLNYSGSSCYGNSDIVYYAPNRAHTNGVQVRPFHSPPPAPLGVHGIVLVEIPGGGGITAPLENATAALGDPYYFWKEKTNGIGYFSIYYSSFDPGEFLPSNAAYENFKVSGVLQFGQLTCTYEYFWPHGVIWLPLLDVGEWDFGTIIADTQTPGCAP